MKPFKSLLIVVADSKFVNKSWTCLMRKIEKCKFTKKEFDYKEEDTYVKVVQLRGVDRYSLFLVHL